MNINKAPISIDCPQIKLWLLSLYKQDQNTPAFITSPTFLDLLLLKKNTLNNIVTSNSKCDFSEEHVVITKVLLDIRTNICAKGNCKLYSERKHRRLTIYNYDKMLTTYSDNIDSLDNLTNEIINIWIHKNEIPNISIKHIKFVKGTDKDLDKKENINIEKFKPIETVFTMIDQMADDNSNKIRKKEATAAPGQKINNPASHRMTYGDLNYLGSNKAIFYFNRGVRGTQIFTNSMYPLKQQPSYKDIVVIDDIVFISNCKCDSANQHKDMFPHYRVTCAVGLTCPARLNAIERIIYARNKNATTEAFTTARSMLIRYW